MLDDALRDRLQALVDAHPVVLFMKGSPTQPQCGFSARVCAILAEHRAPFHSVDVLADDAVRDGMKAFADWPTFPQLWVKGELVGGCDIVEDLHERGGLALALALDAPAPPRIAIHDGARDRILAILGGEAAPLRFVIDAAFEHRFDDVGTVGPDDVTVEANGITLVLDRASAARADGLVLGFEPGPAGGLLIDNPNEPPGVQELDVETYAAWRADGVDHRLVDVRTVAEWDRSRIEGAELLARTGLDALMALDKDTPLVLQCHHGVRSRAVADHLVGHGFRQVYNLTGGIDAWSRRVDPGVPLY